MTILSRRDCITRTPTRDDGGGNEHLLPQAVVTLHEIFHVFQRQCAVVDRARSGKTTLFQRVAASQKCFQSFFSENGRRYVCQWLISQNSFISMWTNHISCTIYSIKLYLHTCSVITTLGRYNVNTARFDVVATLTRTESYLNHCVAKVCCNSACHWLTAAF